MKLLILFLVLNFCVALSASASSNHDLFVVSGKQSSNSSIHTKHVVKLIGKGLCSGTIISENAILTAAHCESSFGEINFGIGEKSRKVTAKAVHEDYNEAEKRTPDIAVIFFEGGLPNGFEPMEMATDDNISEEIFEVFIAGFGQDGSKSAGVLKHFKSFASSEYSDTGLLLVQNNASGSACFGDSGGTTYIVENGKTLLVGVNNTIGPEFEEGAFCKTKFLFSASVPFYQDWISEQQNNYNNLMK